MLDAQMVEGQANQGWREVGRHRGASFRPQEPRRYRSTPRADSPLYGHRCGLPLWGTTDRSPVEGQHCQHRLGGYGLPLRGQRGAPRSRWLPLPRLSQEPVEQADGEERRSRQRRKVEGPRCRRARLRPAEGADGARGAHDRLGASPDEDRASKPRVQHELGSLAHQLTDEGSLRIGAEDLNPARAGDKGAPDPQNNHSTFPRAAIKSVSEVF